MQSNILISDFSQISPNQKNSFHKKFTSELIQKKQFEQEYLHNGHDSVNWGKKQSIEKKEKKISSKQYKIGKSVRKRKDLILQDKNESEKFEQKEIMINNKNFIPEVFLSPKIKKKIIHKTLSKKVDFLSLPVFIINNPLMPKRNLHLLTNLKPSNKSQKLNNSTPYRNNNTCAINEMYSLINQIAEKNYDSQILNDFTNKNKILRKNLSENKNFMEKIVKKDKDVKKQEPINYSLFTEDYTGKISKKNYNTFKIKFPKDNVNCKKMYTEDINQRLNTLLGDCLSNCDSLDEQDLEQDTYLDLSSKKFKNTETQRDSICKQNFFNY